MHKLRIFIDYWNFQLAITSKPGRESYRLDWTKFHTVLIRETNRILNDELSYEGTSFYSSYDPSNMNTQKHKQWVESFISKQPGYRVTVLERKPKKKIRCPDCGFIVDKCPKCQNSKMGTIEKGVDTSLVTDLLSLAWENAWDIAILISSDGDYLPAIRTLNNKGKKVVYAQIPPLGSELCMECWSSINIINYLDELEYHKQK